MDLIGEWYFLCSFYTFVYKLIQLGGEITVKSHQAQILQAITLHQSQQQQEEEEEEGRWLKITLGLQAWP